MKKLLFSVAVLALGMIANVPAAQATSGNTPECRVQSVGQANNVNKPHSAFSIKNNVATVKYTVTGKKNCQATVRLVSWYTLKQGGIPHDAQVRYKVSEVTVGKGTHRISVELPPEGCYYQVDFSVKHKNGKIDIKQYYLNGTRSCIDTPEVPETPETPDVPKTPETPEQELPAELPQTGAAAIAVQLIGATSLGGSAAYYLQSRRK